MLSIRYRNPILEMPINKVERIYGRLTLWHLCLLRGCHTGRCAQAYISDAVQAGVTGVDAADFALTPNCLGGGGVDASGSFGAELRPYGSGSWVKIVTDRWLKDVEPKLGAWEGRLAGRGVVLRGNKLRDFKRALAQSWGIRSTEVFGRVSVTMEKIDHMKGVPITGTEPIPRSSHVWDLERAPALVRGIYQRQLVTDGLEYEHLRPGWLGVVSRMKDRMSTKVYQDWITGDIKVPSPLVDGVGMKYGRRVKDQADGLLRVALGVRNIGWKRLEANLVWLESHMIKEMKRVYSGTLLGV